MIPYIIVWEGVKGFDCVVSGLQRGVGDMRGRLPWGCVVGLVSVRV